MENETVIIFYECDAWHSWSSMNLLGVFSETSELDHYLEQMKRTGKITDDDIEELQRLGQTQGHETNYYIDTQDINPKYEPE